MLFRSARFHEGDIDYAPTGGESYRQAAQRVLSAVADLFESLRSTGMPPRYSAVFCHAGVLRIVSTLYAAESEPKDLFKTGFANAERLVICSNQVSLPSYWVKG